MVLPLLHYNISVQIMKLTILSWNVNGIRAAVAHGFEAWLKKARPDILCLQEIKLDNARRAKIQFDFAGYDEYWFPAERRGYSGTAMLIKTGFKIGALKNGLGAAEFDNEGRTQTLESDKFFLVNAYFPNAQPELRRLAFKESFNRKILAYIKKLEKTKPVLVGGDFNVAHREIDLARPATNVGQPGFSDEERAWVDRFAAENLADTFRQLHPKSVAYSWWSYRGGARERDVGWRIDYFWTSKRFLPHIRRAFILDEVKGSDHCPVGVEIEV